MRFESQLGAGKLLRRYKRFLADVDVGGEIVTMHCANTGAMTGCSDPGSRVWYSRSRNTKRKYLFSLELIETQESELICINTLRANKVVREALESGLIDIVGDGEIRNEVPIEDESGRFDFGIGQTVIEVKSVTFGIGERGGAFPDAISLRAQRHAYALGSYCQSGKRGVLIFLSMHSGIDWIRPADEIDPDYGRALRFAMTQGLEVLAFGCLVSSDEVRVNKKLQVVL